ncbi:MAG: transposase [Alkaliphilus sp.]|nr:MAG: transposase [Alkaliphilus sp.]
MPNKYSDEVKLLAIKRMQAPEKMPAIKLSKEMGISTNTLLKWKKEVKAKGDEFPQSTKRPYKWSSKDKFHVVIETAAMTEEEVSIYCRSKGILKEQINEWKLSCSNANKKEYVDVSSLKSELSTEKQTTKALKKELRRKEKALAETAALLVLQKKVQAIWGEPEDD